MGLVWKSARALEGIIMSKHTGKEYDGNRLPRVQGEGYQKLIENIQSGYALHEVICDDQGKPVDYRFLEINQAFELITGFKAEAVLERTVMEIMPQTETIWVERYGQVALTGEPARFEEFSQPLGRYFEVTAYCTVPGRFACFFNDITDRKQQERALLESEERFQALFEQAPLGYQSLDEDGRFLVVNQAWLDTLGYKREEVIGKWFGDFLAPEFVPFFQERFPRFKAVGKVHTEFEMLNRDGERLIVDFDGRIGHTLEGDFKQTHCILQDVTERKQAEIALLESEERGRRAIADSPIPIMIHDEEDKVLQLSAGWTRYSGYTIEDIPTLADWTERAYGEKTGTKKEYIEELFSIDKTVENGEWEVTAKDGSKRIWAFQSTPLGRMHHGKRVLHSMAVDITEERQAQLALAAEKERLAVTLRSIGDGVITTDTDGRILILNRAAEQMTGWKADEAIGRPLLEVFNIIDGLTREPCKNPVDRVLATSLPDDLAENTWLIAKDGREIAIADSCAPIHDFQSRVIGVALVFRDMTEKKNIESIMLKSQKLESLGILAGGIAHDFNNILVGIFGYVEMAKEETHEAIVSELLEQSLNNINRARALTQQLLTFAKGGAPIRKAGHLFPFVQETVQFALSGSPVSASFQIQEDLWPCDFDRNQIGQVIDNLTINAQQAMPNGGTIAIKAKNVSLAAREHATLAAGEYAVISFADQGTGMPKEFLPRIFDPYFSTKSKGHGLGLATCYSIVNRHGGCIDVESEPGKGSTFHVYLPTSRKSVSALDGTASNRHAGSGTFLVMDDEEPIRMVFKRMLESFGYTVVLMESGREVIDFCRAEAEANRDFSGMVFDLTIPGGMGGRETIVEIRKIYPDTPIFVSSGYSEDAVMADPELHGFTGSIIKPFVTSDLSAALDEGLRKRE